jgi:hypothetical protein
MKSKYIIFITGLICVFNFSGCEKFLVHDHPTDISDADWWQTEQNATNALNSIYAGIPHGFHGRQIAFLDALSDNLVQRQSARGNYEAYVKGLQNSSWDKSLHIYRDNYKNIRRANRFLENIDRVVMDYALKTRYKYEARALRAYYYYELLVLFGGVPLVTHSVNPANADYARNTYQEVYDFVLSELTETAEFLPNIYSNIDRSRVASGRSWAIICRLALFNHDYQTAKIAAKKIIDSKVYRLHNSGVRNGYQDLFLYSGESNGERVYFSNGGAAQVWTTLVPPSQGGKNVLSPTQSIVDAYETKQGKTIQELGPDSLAIYRKNPNYKNNRDPRLIYSIMLPNDRFMTSILNPFDQSPNNKDRIGESYSTFTGYWVKKYIDERDKEGVRGLDFTIIRYSEVLLSYVETLIETGDWTNPDVINYLNQVRNRAGMPSVNVSVYNSQEKLRELVRRERRVELAFEGVRYFDIRRWGIFEEVMNGQVYGAYDPNTGDFVKVEVRKASKDRDFFWPIPLEEMLANKNMVQNPNY